MPQQTDSWRDRPSAKQSGSTSAAFAFATEPPQHAQPTLPRNRATDNAGTIVASVVPRPYNQSSTTSGPTSNEHAKRAPTTAGTAANEVDQLEDEVIHFMNLSMEEKEKSEVLSGRLELVTLEKKDLERQIDELDQDLSQNGWAGQDDDASATEAGDTMSRVNAKIAKLRTSAQKLESDFKSLAVLSDQRTKTIAELEEKLRITREQLAQKTQEEERLRKELEQTKETLSSEKNNNDKLLSNMKTLQQQCNELDVSNALTRNKLAESEQTRGNLSGLVKRKTTELEDVQKAGNSQAETMRQELDRKQKEIERLLATQKDLMARCEQPQALSRQQSQLVPPGHPVPRKQIKMYLKSNPGLTVEAGPTRGERDEAVIIKLTKELKRNQERRLRAVAIGIDLSGSAAGSLTDGIKRVYKHLLDTLQSPPYKTYVMTVIHGPGDTVTVKSQFGDTWAAHEKVLEGQEANGKEQHVECLRKIKEVAVSTGLVLDLQVVLIGDSHTEEPSHVGAHEVCQDFSSSHPVVHIHSIVVKTGSTEDTEKYWGGLEAWQPWNYVSGTGGNMVSWCMKNALPDLSDLVC